MMINFFSLKTNYKNIYFIKEEVELFNKIDPNIINNFKKILNFINKTKINFKIFNEEMDDKFLVSFIDNKSKNFYPLDYKNPWSNYNFFLNYFKFGNYKFDIKVFQKMHMKLKQYNKIVGINKRLKFLPIYFYRNKKRNIFRFLPSFIFKDKSFLSENHFRAFYCRYYEKSIQIKNLYNFVSNNLSNESSKKNYNIVFNKSMFENNYNYFKKAHKLYQYSDYLKLDEQSVIINCGVENGMELKIFNNVNKIYNVDPCEDYYLDESVKYILSNSKTKNFFLKYALYEDNNIDDHTKQNKDYSIKKLPDIIKKYKINKISLIKLDIEGAERLLLDDLIQIAKKYSCQIAISIYHTFHKGQDDEKLSDYVQIPYILMNKLKNKYNFYFNNYSYQRWESILYCIPRK